MRPSRRPCFACGIGLFALLLGPPSLGACASRPITATTAMPRAEAAPTAMSRAAALRASAASREAAYLKSGRAADLDAAITSLEQLEREVPPERADSVRLAALLQERAAARGVADETARKLATADLMASTLAAKRGLSDQASSTLAELERGAAPGALSTDALDVEALYRVARGLLLHAELEGHAQRLLAQAVASGLLEHCAAQAPELDGAGADRLLGQLRARPAYAEHRSLQAAKAHFDSALARAAGDPRNHLDFALHYAVPAQDRSAFERALAGALGSTEATPRAARARAQSERLQALTAELFE